MIKIIQNLFIGNDNDCFNTINNFAIVHACKTCHQKGVGYRGNLKPSHPNYLIYEIENHLFLNMVDMEQELLPKYTHPIMQASMRFIDKYILNKEILVHCNQGFSRSPSIVLLYLTRTSLINTNSYQEAKIEFINKYYKYFNPSRGIELYFMKNWNELINGV